MTTREIIERIWAGRAELRKVGLDPGRDGIEIIMSVDLHMRLMVHAPEFPGVIVVDHKLPAGVRVFGLVVRRDPSFRPNEMTFRSEVQI